jgi:hypothetical protein
LKLLAGQSLTTRTDILHTADPALVLFPDSSLTHTLLLLSFGGFRLLTLVQGFGSGNTIDCECDFVFNGDRGFGVDIKCAYTQEFCLVDRESFCGTPYFEGTYGLKGPSYSTACFNFTGTSENYVSDLCITGKHSVKNPTKFAECEVTYGEEVCDICEICGNGRQVRFDCSNIEFDDGLESTTIDGPVVGCVGIGLVPSLRGEKGAIEPFGAPSDWTPA